MDFSLRKRYHFRVLYVRGNQEQGEAYMGVVQKIEALREKHQALEQALEQLESRTNPDDVKIGAVKKQKLRIKDEIAELTRQ
ncbi:MAG: YdcH family protein [Rhodospirillales bacterium]